MVRFWFVFCLKFISRSTLNTRLVKEGDMFSKLFAPLLNICFAFTILTQTEPKTTKNKPNMIQKQTKYAPKTNQICSKNIPNMLQKQTCKTNQNINNTTPPADCISTFCHFYFTQIWRKILREFVLLVFTVAVHSKLDRRRRLNTGSTLWLHSSASFDFKDNYKKSKYTRLLTRNSKQYCSS